MFSNADEAIRVKITEHGSDESSLNRKICNLATGGSRKI